MQYLRDHQHYIDRYDLHTIEECLDYYWSLKNGMEKHRSDLKDLSPEQFDKEIHKGVSYVINVLKGEKYRHKKETINQWMDRDRKMQELIDNTNRPAGILCKVCSSPMVVTSKDLFNAYEETARVVFMLKCMKCNKRQAVYEDGTEWIYSPPLCPKCKSPLQSNQTHKKNVLTTTYLCPSCSYRKTDIDDFSKWEKERKDREARENELLAKYRADFCLSDTDGPSYLASLDKMYALAKEFKEREEKEKNPIYQQAMKLKKISIVTMEKLIVDVITPQKYVRFTLGQPIMGRYVEVLFTAQDTDSSRREYDSQHGLKKLITKALDGTNWRLMSDGIIAKLGVLNGRLKGVDQEEDLMVIVKE